jgi:hypothetical protein
MGFVERAGSVMRGESPAAQGVAAALRLQGVPVAALPQGVASAARTQGERRTNEHSVVLLHPLSEATPPEAVKPPTPPERSDTPSRQRSDNAQHA